MSYSVMPAAFWGLGADAPDADPFFTMKDGVRYWNESSTKELLEALATMSILPQMPAVDDRGIRLILTPGATPGIISTKDAVLAMARAGNTVLLLDAFQANIDQVIRLVTDPNVLAALTDPGKTGNYAVLLTPGQATAAAPWATPLGPIPPVLPPPAPPPPATIVPTAPPGTTPAAPSSTQAAVSKLTELAKSPTVWIVGGLVGLALIFRKG